MSLIMSLWSSNDMTWLDGGEGGCNAPESCNVDNVNVAISNMVLNGQHAIFGQKQSVVEYF